MPKGATVLERHSIGGQTRPAGGTTVPPKVNINTGGKGGTVVLIMGTLFVGYLYFTRRLPNVFKAIAMPGNMTLATVAPVPGGLQPAPVPRGSIVPRAGSRKIHIILPPPYHQAPLEIEIAIGTSSDACRRLVFEAVFQRTGSNTLAELYSRLD